MSVSSISTLSLREIAQKTRQAAGKLGILPIAERDLALEAIAESQIGRAHV